MTTSKQAMSVDDAVANCIRHIRGPVVLERLAAHGIVPRNEKEASDLLYLADCMNHARQSQAVKTAGDSRFAGEVQAVSDLLRVQPPAHVPLFKQAASDMLQDPQLYESVLTLLAAEQQA